jgi:hypothetical protein
LLRHLFRLCSQRDCKQARTQSVRGFCLDEVSGAPAANACVLGGAEAAYSREVRLLFSLRPSSRDFAPSSPILFMERLQTSEQTKCQRVLTVRMQAWGGILERREGLVRLKALCDVLCALRTQLVVLEAANKSRKRVLAALTVGLLIVFAVCMATVSAQMVQMRLERPSRRTLPSRTSSMLPHARFFCCQQPQVSEAANACVLGGAEAAYSRDVRLLFSLRPSASAFAPSSPILFP